MERGKRSGISVEDYDSLGLGSREEKAYETFKRTQGSGGFRKSRSDNQGLKVRAN